MTTLVGMNRRYLCVLAAAPFAALTLSPWAMALSLDDAPSAPTYLAQATATTVGVEPGLLSQPVTDEAGVLTAAERSEIESAISQVSASQGKSVRVVFLSSFGEYTPSEWVDRAVAANGSNTAVLAISPDQRAYNVGGGTEWTQGEIDRMNQAAHSQLAQMNWGQAALDAVESVGGCLLYTSPSPRDS